MTLLALECSSSRRSFAVARDGQVLAEASHAAGRATPFFALIADVLARANVPRETLDALVIGLGPGSYTGIRAAIAAAQGWELAHGVKLLGLDSVAACALRCQRLGFRGPTALVVDAQRDEFHVAEYDLTDASSVLLAPLHLASRSDVERLHAAGTQLAGPDAGVRGLPGETVFPDAAALAELATGRTEFIAPGLLAPIYLRPAAFVKSPPPPLIP